MSFEKMDFNQEPEAEETPVEEEQAADTAQPGRLKRWFQTAVAAGAMLAGTHDAEAQSPSAKEAGMKPLVEGPSQLVIEVSKELCAKAQPWINELNVPKLTAGLAKTRIRNGSESIGLYLDEKFIGDIHSPAFTKHTRKTVLEGVAATLDQIKVKHDKLTSPEDPNLEELSVGKGVLEKIKELGMKTGTTVENGKRQMYISANTELADKKDSVFYYIDAQSDGKADTYASLSVSEDGALVLEGKDGDRFRMEFTKAKGDEKVTVTDKSPKKPEEKK